MGGISETLGEGTSGIISGSGSQCRGERNEDPSLFIGTDGSLGLAVVSSSSSGTRRTKRKLDSESEAGGVISGDLGLVGSERKKAREV